MNNGQQFKAKANVKAMIIYVDEADGHRILIIAVRGTVTKDDWMLNVNNAPKKSSKVGLCILCSAGYLLIAQVAPKHCCLARRVPDRCEGDGEANRQGNPGYQRNSKRYWGYPFHRSFCGRSHCAALLCHE